MYTGISDEVLRNSVASDENIRDDGEGTENVDTLIRETRLPITDNNSGDEFNGFESDGEQMKTTAKSSTPKVRSFISDSEQ